MRFSNWRPGALAVNKVYSNRYVLLTTIKTYGVEGIDILSGETKSFNSAVLRAVPITLEFLVTLNFVQINKCLVFNNCWIKPLQNGFFGVEFNETKDTVQYMHELQNLYVHESKVELFIPVAKVGSVKPPISQKQVNTDIQKIRLWFEKHKTAQPELRRAYMKLLDLLKEGMRTDLVIGQRRCHELYELFWRYTYRIDRIENKDIKIPYEEKQTNEELYNSIRSLIIVTFK